MKHFTSLYTITLLAAALFIPNVILAETDVNISNNGSNSKTDVNVETNTGNNTICQNGKCTTTESGNGKSTVCINGKCTSSEDGNLDIKSDNGNTRVNIKNKGSATRSAESNNVNTTINKNSSSDQASKAAQEKKTQIKKQIVNQRNAIEKIFDRIRDLFKSLNFF